MIIRVVGNIRERVAGWASRQNAYVQAATFGLATGIPLYIAGSLLAWAARSVF